MILLLLVTGTKRKANVKIISYLGTFILGRDEILVFEILTAVKKVSLKR